MNFKLAIIAVVLSFLCSSCKKDPEPLYSKGMITGSVRTYDGSDATNTRIVAHGPYGNPSAMSDSDGKYKLPGLGNGTYEIEFSKEGYGKKFVQGIQVLGNDTISLNIRLIKKADYSMPKLSTVLYYSSFPNMDEYSIAIVTDIPDTVNKEMQIRVFVSDVKDVSNLNYIHSDQAHAVKRENNTQVLVVTANPQIVNSGGEHVYKKGQTLYLIAYVCNKLEEGGEFNEYYGLPVFSTVDEQQHSKVIEIKAP